MHNYHFCRNKKLNLKTSLQDWGCDYLNPDTGIVLLFNILNLFKKEFLRMSKIEMLKRIE